MSAWQNSTRRDRLPPDWPKRRARILKRDDHACQVREDGRRCGQRATEVDHIRAGDDHSESNLQAICEWHHKKKSGSEGGAAQAAARRRIRYRYQRTEDHPGLL